jgi:hypothetical protein
MLTERGLGAALAELRRRAKIPVRLDVRVPGRPSAEVETVAYFVVSEALQNATRHAPGAQVEVRVEQVGQELVVLVRDDGPGGADVAAGSGLRGLRDRVEAIGGRLAVDSLAGQGTTVRAHIPNAAPMSDNLAGASAAVRAIPVPPATVAVGVPADVVRRRPDVRAAEMQLAAQSAQIGISEIGLISVGVLQVLASQIGLNRIQLQGPCNEPQKHLRHQPLRAHHRLLSRRPHRQPHQRLRHYRHGPGRKNRRHRCARLPDEFDELIMIEPPSHPL